MYAANTVDGCQRATGSDLMSKGKGRAVVLLSGGMDSCVCAVLACRDYEAAAVHVSYGQRTEERERQSVLAICRRLQGDDKVIVRNEAPIPIGEAPLTRAAHTLPAAWTTRPPLPTTP